MKRVLKLYGAFLLAWCLFVIGCLLAPLLSADLGGPVFLALAWSLSVVVIVTQLCAAALVLVWVLRQAR